MQVSKFVAMRMSFMLRWWKRREAAIRESIKLDIRSVGVGVDGPARPARISTLQHQNRRVDLQQRGSELVGREGA